MLRDTLSGSEPHVQPPSDASKSTRANEASASFQEKAVQIPCVVGMVILGTRITQSAHQEKKLDFLEFIFMGEPR